MRDYVTEGKRKGSLEPYRLSEVDGYIVNEVHDGIELAEKKVIRSVWVNVALKEGKIENCDFSYTIFINCYFRSAVFRGCNFSGCKFFECNFRGATLVDCRLQYTKWRETHIKRQTVLACLPSFPNVAQELVINLRMNAASVGEYDDARYFLYKSESLSREHLRKTIFQYSDYYHKYSTWDRLRAAASLCRSYFEKYFWGYGEKPLTLIFVSAMVMFAFAVTYLVLAPSYFGLSGADPRIIDSFLHAVRFSVLVFSGNLPQDLPVDVRNALDAPVTTESLFGIMFIAFLAASLHRKISTRRD